MSSTHPLSSPIYSRMSWRLSCQQIFKEKWQKQKNLLTGEFEVLVLAKLRNKECELRAKSSLLRSARKNTSNFARQQTVQSAETCMPGGGPASALWFCCPSWFPNSRCFLGSSHTVCTCYLTSRSGTSVARRLGPVLAVVAPELLQVNDKALNSSPQRVDISHYPWSSFQQIIRMKKYMVTLISVFQCYICPQPPSAFLSSYLWKCVCIGVCVCVWMPRLCLLEPSNWRVSIGNYQRMEKEASERIGFVSLRSNAFIL